MLQTFRPNKKSIPEGTLRYGLHRQANASLHSGLDLKLVVKLPPGEDLNDWIAIHGSFRFIGQRSILVAMQTAASFHFRIHQQNAV